MGSDSTFLRSAARTAVPLVWAGILTGLLVWAVFPGFMSYDSLHALREARGTVQGASYPPFVSYVWRVFDAIWPGPTLMLAAQDFVLLVAVGSLCRTFGYGIFGTLLGIALFAAVPAILGPMLVVWKDVAVSACFCAACALIGVAQRAAGTTGRRVALATALAAIFAGMAYRFNAAAGAVPLLIWWVAASRNDAPSRRSFFAWTAGGATLAALLFAVVAVINSYGFPDMRRLAPNPSMNSIRVYDLLGMSAIEKRSVVPAAVLPGDPVALGEYAAMIYTPRHINLWMEADRDGVYRALFMVDPDRIADAWREAIASHPQAYLIHRWRVSEVLVGMQPGAVFISTYPSVDANEFGMVHVPSRLTPYVLDYIREHCGEISCATLPCRPWAWYLLGAAATALCVLRGSARVRQATIATFAGGIAYLVPQFFIDPAGDLRYNHWAIVAMAICCLAAARLIFERVRALRRDSDAKPMAAA